MVEKKYLHLLQSVFSQVLGGKSKTVLCTYSSSQDTQPLILEFLKTLPGNPRVFQCKTPQSQSPYYPFLNWVYDAIPPENPDFLERLLIKARVYSLHRNLFVQDFQGVPASRQEELIYEELKYERNQMKLSIFRLLDELYFEKPTIFILEDVNLYPASTLDFLMTLLPLVKSKPVFFLFTLNERKVVANPYAAQAWQDLHQMLQGDLLELSLSSSGVHNEALEKPRSFGLHDYLRLKNFLCLQDCLFQETSLGLRPEEVKNPEERDLLLSMADVYFQTGDYSTALLLYRNLLKWEKKQNDLRMISILYRKLGYVFFIRNNTPESRKWALQALKLAQNIKDEQQVFYSLFLIMIIDSREPFYTMEEWRTLYKQFITIGENQGFINSLAYRLSKPDRLNPVDSEEESDSDILRAIGLAKIIGNELRLANAYHILGYHKLFAGKLDQVMPLYKKSEALRKRIGNPLELAYLNNGTGYFLHQCGDFIGAAPYLYRSVEYALEAKDYHEMSMGLCNISINFLYSLQYESAAFHLDKVIRLMSIAEIQTLSFHTYREILLLYATSMFLAGNTARAYEKYSVIASLKHNFHPQAKTSGEQDEILIEALFLSLLKEHEGELPRALEILKQERETLFQNYQIITYRIPYFLLFYGDMLLRANRLTDARKEWELGLEIARKHNYGFYEEILQQRTGERERDTNRRPGVKRVDFDRILESARANMDLQKLHKVMDKIDFLNSFQQVQEQHKTPATVSAKSLELINTTFPSDALIFSLQTAGTWHPIQELYSPDLEWIHMEILPTLVGSLTNKYKEIVVLTPEQEPLIRNLPFRSVTHIPVDVSGKTPGHFFLGSLQNPLHGSAEDLQILDIASVQLLRTLEKLNQEEELAEKSRMLEGMNAELTRLASTDSLTSLNNRGALLGRLFEERDRTERYQDKGHQSFSLLFIDLDNFKYYNDEFGHKLGDAILKEFSQIIKNSIRTVDFASRYGGDEFVLLLPETTTQESLVVAQRILQELKAREGFKDLVETYSGLEATIPQDKILSCSIGITQYPRDAATTPEQLLHLADTALYEAKRQGKNCVRIYGEIVGS